MNRASTCFVSKQRTSTVKVRGAWTHRSRHRNRLSHPTVGRCISNRSAASIHCFDLDLPQLHVVSYDSKENFLHFDYLPGDDRLMKLKNEQLCLNIRQSPNGAVYRPVDACLPIQQNRVQWLIEKEFPYLKLSICSNKHKNICGQEIEMKEGRVTCTRRVREKIEWPAFLSP